MSRAELVRTVVELIDGMHDPDLTDDLEHRIGALEHEHPGTLRAIVDDPNQAIDVRGVAARLWSAGGASFDDLREVLLTTGEHRLVRLGVLYGLEQRIESIEDAVRQHRNARAHDRCWQNDLELYEAVLPGEPLPFSPELPCREEFLARCCAYYDEQSKSLGEDIGAAAGDATYRYVGWMPQTTAMVLHQIREKLQVGLEHVRMEREALKHRSFRIPNLRFTI